MATQASTPRGGNFFASNSTVAGNDASTCNNLCTLGKDCSTVVGNGSWDNTHTSDLSSTGGRLSKEPSVLVQHAQHTNGSSDG